MKRATPVGVVAKWILAFFVGAVPGLFSTVNAQIQCGDFEDLDPCSFTPINGQFPSTSTPFQDGCVNGDWFVSHGTPEVSYAFSDHWGSMWAGNFNGSGVPSISAGEGLFLKCDFVKDRIYRISVDIRTYRFLNGGYTATNVDNVRFYLANGLVNSTNTSTSVPLGNHYLVPNVPDKELIYNLNSYSSLSVSGHSIVFMPSKDYESLWIFPEDNDNPISHLHIDNVQEIECSSTQYYTNTSSLPVLTGRSDWILADGAGGGPVTVGALAKAHFRAGSWIQLNPGFNTTNGSLFSAIIEPCGSIDCVSNDAFPFRDKSSRETSEGNMLKSLGSESEVGFKVTAFPNPVETTLSLHWESKDAVVSIIVRDISGRVVKFFESEYLSNVSIDMSSIESGVHFVECQSSSGAKSVIRFIKD